MGIGLLTAHLEAFEEIGAGIGDKRRKGYDLKYEYEDAIKGAYGVFFFQHPSMLEYQERLKQQKQRNNIQSILKVKKIPSNNQITRLLDKVEPEEFAEVFTNGLHRAEKYGALEQYAVLEKKHCLVALDGVWFYQSREIHCEHCLHHELKDGEPVYYHTMVAGALMRPGFQTVLPLMPEFIRNEDGAEKQDCERTAAKRWLERHAQRYRWLNPVFLGDDLYADYPTCTAIMAENMSFLFTCKPDSHPWLYDALDKECMEHKTVTLWTGRTHREYRYRWYNGVEIRQELPTLKVNYLYLEIGDEQKGKVSYKNSWISDLEVKAENVVELVECARARWKIENEHNNVLKHHGYHLEHNFGHGQEHACEIYALLNLLAFQMHGILLLLDEGYQKARGSCRRRDEFFAGLRFMFDRYVFQTWEEFIGSITGDDEPDG